LPIVLRDYCRSARDISILCVSIVQHRAAYSVSIVQHQVDMLFVPIGAGLLPEC
jgi:hypothetical protein